VPLFTPANVHDVARVVHDTPPGEIVTVYSTVPDTLTAGHEMVSLLVDDVVAFAVVGVTGSGTTVVVVVVVGASVVVGATVVVVPETPAMRDFVPAVPAPTPLIAFTDTVYVVPSARPVSVHVKVDAFVVHPAVEGVVVTW
jgi:hypothetical protein